MALTFKIYTDSALTTELVGNLIATQNADSSTPPIQFQLFIGSVTASRKIEANSNPGVDQISVSIVDAAVASGHEATEVKLATTQGGLAASTPAAPLDLGLIVNSGAGNGAEFWIEADDVTGVIGTSVELSVDTNALIESVV